ncbi:hypothetical protein B0H19DRAFT_1202261 [Mycena capillaripes]|nr:hypothetical protein B0H19DRAFT_1202261 [Mycena capillaripes]
MDWLSSMIPLPIRRGVARTLGFDSSPDDPEDPDTTLLDRPLQLQDLLVYIILDFAAYCAPLTSAVRAQQVQIHASRSPGDSASLNYLVTPPTLDQCRHEDKTLRVKVMRVEFSILSRDQGWCNDPNIRGTYFGSSWFEAAILRPSQASDAAAALRLARAADASTGLDVYDPALEVRAADADANDGTRWALQQNFCGSREYRQHVVSWAITADGSRTDTNAGAGAGGGFVASLRPGDGVAVIARARYPAWANFVERVEVSVYYGLA